MNILHSIWPAYSQRKKALSRTIFLLFFLFMVTSLVQAVDQEQISDHRYLLHNTGIDSYLMHDRSLQVRVPPGFDSNNGSYPLLICFDGQPVLSPKPGERGGRSLNMNMVHDELLSEGLIEPAVIVTIPNSDPNRRWFELRPQRDGDDGELQQTHAFITERLLPYVREHFAVGPGWEHVGVTGCSMGGLAANWLLTNHPEIYGFSGGFSPPFTGDSQAVIFALPADGGALKGRQLFIDWGNEEGMFRPINLYRPIIDALTARGWREGKDVAWRLNQGGHRYQDWQNGVRSMWLLWLGSDEVAPHELTMHTWNSDTATLSKPREDGELSRIVARVRDQRGLEYHLNNPAFVVSPDIIRFAPAESGMPLAQHPGTTSVSLSYQGLDAAIVVESFDPDQQIEQFALLRAPENIQVDGSLSEWSDIPMHTDRSNTYSWAASYRDQTLFIMVDVDDEQVLSEQKTQPWRQDGIELRVDHRPLPRLMLGRGMDERFYLHLAALSPSPDRATLFHGRRAPHNAIKAVCIQREGGWVAEIAIAGGRSEAGTQQWDACRINIMVNDLDEAGGKIQKKPWRSDWRWPSNRVGSSIFVKAE